MNKRHSKINVITASVELSEDQENVSCEVVIDGEAPLVLIEFVFRSIQNAVVETRRELAN